MLKIIEGILMRVDSQKPKCKAPIGWLGGKSRLAPTIISCIPPHFVYAEIFLGSGVVFFGKPPEISKVEIINDVHKELVNLMMVLSGTYFDESVREEFISYVRNMPASRDCFETWKYWKDDQLEKLTPAQRAFRFYYCVKKGFSSMPTGGYEASPFSLSRYNMSTDFEPFAARFRASNAQIERLDFKEFINKYNNPRADVFFFGDPPYFVADSSYYEHVFKHQDHTDLKSCCDEIQKNNNKFLLTYDDVPEVINLYKDYFIYRTDFIVYKAQSMEKKSELKKQELFITNYNIADLVQNRISAFAQDIFDDPVAINDRRIEFNGALGLERIN